MKAAIYYGPRDIRIEDIPVPTVSDDEILVRVKACGICGSDLHLYRRGMFGSLLGRPFGEGRIIGHELSGVVTQVGRKVSTFRPGDRIAGVGMGGFAEYIPLKITDWGPYHLSDDICFDEGATLEPLATSIHAVNLAQLKEGETVIILGAGMIGLGCLQFIRNSTPCRVIVVEPSPLRLKKAKELGADDTINPEEVDPLEAVTEITGDPSEIKKRGKRGGNVDVVIDCAGSHLTPDQGLRMLKRFNGRLVVVALYERQTDLDLNLSVIKHVNIYGSWGWNGDDFRKAIDLLKTGRIRRRDLISHKYPLEEIDKAFEIQSRPDLSIRVIIIP
ncbi:MAG: zinc-binding dehydrogenase [Candidatus Bathyarchaeia archaeon]